MYQSYLRETNAETDWSILTSEDSIMSSPLSNLKKSRKTPILMGGISHSQAQQGNRCVPFRGGPEILNDETLLLDDVTSGMLAHKASRSTPLPKLVSNSNGSPRSQPIPAAAPSDMDLMSVMMSRLAALEQRIASQSREISEKDRKLRIYEDKIRILQRARDEGNPGRCQELEKKCLRLQKEVHDMEAFLADYGMVWVGDDKIDDSVYNDDDLISLTEEESGLLTDSNPVWRPAVSRAGEDFKVDFNLIVKNVEELNVLAGEGVAKIQHTMDGARLKMPDPVSLTLYANGILMFNGPFRPFTDPTTQACVTDLMDGFFPSELQDRYPDGIPIALTDKRGVYFRDRLNETFAGVGQVLGGDTRPSRLVPSNLNKSTSPRHKQEGALVEESSAPGPKLSVDQFLNKIPSSVIKNGKIVDVRGGLADRLKGNADQPQRVTVVDTAAVQEMKERMSIDESRRPPSSRHVTTLRIRSDQGQTFIVKMKFSERIGDLRAYLDKQLQTRQRYDIMSTFPSRTYSDNDATLEASGLVPNATLHLRVLKY